MTATGFGVISTAMATAVSYSLLPQRRFTVYPICVTCCSISADRARVPPSR